MARSTVKSELPRIIIASIIGLGLMAFGVINIKNNLAARKWPTVTGIITSSSADADGTKYIAHVSYTFNLDSVSYSSDKILYSGTYRSNKSSAEAVTSKYPLDSQVKVYYNPDDPQRACLEPEIPIHIYIMFAVGLALFALVTWELVSLLRKKTGTEQ